jgi:hypothetical protein
METQTMLNKTLVAGVVALAGMSLAGTAGAACSSGPIGAGYYRVCLGETYVYSYPYYSASHSYSNLYVDQFAGVDGVFLRASQSQYDYSFDYNPIGLPCAGSGSGNNVDAYGGDLLLASVGAGAGQYSYSQDCFGTYSGQSTYLSSSAGYVSQDVFNGSCFINAYTIAGGVSQPCGAVPLIPIL